jgi:uncharacterized protein YndB with AHSA1/START domain
MTGAHMRIPIIIAALLTAAPASAEVVSAGPHGFHVRHSVQLVVPPQEAFAAFGRVGSWWDDEHTYSGSSDNMTMSLRPGGCFCERVPDGGGGIEHMRVTYVAPGERAVLTGSLGPLLFEATAGVMDVKFEGVAGGSRVTMDYKAAGFAGGGADTMAPLVDEVLAEQMRRFRAATVPQVKR